MIADSLAVFIDLPQQLEHSNNESIVLTLI